MNEAREPHSPSTRVEGGGVAFDHILGRQYTVFDGLAGMHVEDIYQDRRGLLWSPPPTAGSAASTEPGSRPSAPLTGFPISTR